MKVLCFGSANLDHVYKVNHFTVPGETQGCLEYTVKCGGKGVNQAIALSLAGNETYFAGIIGNDGTLLKDALVGKNVNIDYLKIDVLHIPIDDALQYSGQLLGVWDDRRCEELRIGNDEQVFATENPPFS